MAQDVFKILKDLELKAVGLDPATNIMQSGYFAAFRSIGLPILAADFANPFTPTGANLDKPVSTPSPADPKDAPKTGSGNLTEVAVAAPSVGRSQQSFLNTFLLTDSKLQMNNTWSVIPGSSKVSDSWYAIITGANGIPTVQGLKPGLQKAYDDALAKLRNPDGTITDHYKAYRDYQSVYNKKVQAMHKAYADCLTDPAKLQSWPETGLDYDNDASQAKKDWEDFGFKEEIDNATAILSA